MRALSMCRSHALRAIDENPAHPLTSTHCSRGDTALRLVRFFSTTPDFWLNLQTHYDLEIAQRSIGRIINQIQTVNAA